MTIAEISKKTGVSKDSLRYYEKIGLITDVPRNESGLRAYSEENLQRVDFIACMRRAGMSIKALTEYLQCFEQGDQTVARRREILAEQRDDLELKIADLQAMLEYLDYKIDNYDKLVKSHKF